ncbi:MULTISPECIES: hypothetical protein [Lactiplantibacillus]|uniref:hypothetical protein n=1 Tax=Lactiplantibacillus TaxID=2767842 RepID=UPI000978231C|nr:MULTISPECIES: hypothetical protein [Lactiplantibacillus]MDL2063466.1 hypothetical protein [Lactiplantibacillus paraplantarum]PKX58725.1 hypothetical protein CUR48_08965 [Lactiplantibacillus plantarum]
MNCNKKIIYFGAILFSLLSLGTIKGRADTTVTGTVHNEMIGTFSKKNTSARTIATMKKIAYEDPSITVIEGNDSVTVSENLGTSHDVQLYVQGRKVAVTNGKFSTRVNSSKSTTFVVSDKGTGTTVETAKNSNHIHIINKISYGKMINAMDNMNNTHGSTSKTFLGFTNNRDQEAVNATFDELLK